MLDRENFLKWQATREEADREWRTKEAEKDRQWRAEQEKIRSRKEEEGQRLRLRWEIIIFGVIVTLILVAAQIASAFIGRGDLFGSAPVRQVSDTRGLQPPVNP
jgi:hypothetical protein